MTEPQTILQVPLTRETSVRIEITGPWTEAAAAQLGHHLYLLNQAVEPTVCIGCSADGVTLDAAGRCEHCADEKAQPSAEGT